MEDTIGKFISGQLSVWPLAARNYRKLKGTKTRLLEVGGLEVKVQYNPERKISSEAPLDQASVAARPCFLCPANRPAEQEHIDFEGRKGRRYRITLNPYPVFPSHIVISSAEHTRQSIWNRYQDILDFVGRHPGRTCIYNGPESGASAPDHLHFQAFPAGLTPLETRIDSLLDENSQTPSQLEYITCVKEAKLFHLKEFTTGVFVLQGSTPKSMTKLFYRLLDCAPLKDGSPEPRFNLVTWYHGDSPHGEWRSAVIFREKHRPSNYWSDGPDHLAMSPGCADMAGVFITVREEDFKKLDSSLLSKVVKEVSIPSQEEARIISRLTRKQRKIEVGIMSGQEIAFEIISDGAGPQKVQYSDGKIYYNGVPYDELVFDAQTESKMFAEPSFILHDVRIGIDFHWDRRMNQRFAGALKFITDGKSVIAVNVIGIEDYLLSVISSEMRPTASLEFLKAHAVISRSWLLALLEGGRGKRRDLGCDNAVTKAVTAEIEGDAAGGQIVKSERKAAPSGTDEEFISWFDHEDHELFDVCADDHCQRYQGLPEISSCGETAFRNVRAAIDQTWGQVLEYEGKICDCRFSKCCGGRTELFSTCWQPIDFPYLQSVPDSPRPIAATAQGQRLDGAVTAESQPKTSPELVGQPVNGIKAEADSEARPFCDTDDEEVLRQVLNDYDLETKDFFSWETRYGRKEISEIVKARSGVDFGTIRDLIPMEAGPSGRLSKLRIVGDKRQMVIGKELIIRRWLSTTHLKSSAFEPSWEGDELVLKGRGWGHGVGLCQIGAAVMASKGYDYEHILEHYYPGATLTRHEKA